MKFRILTMTMLTVLSITPAFAGEIIDEQYHRKVHCSGLPEGVYIIIHANGKTEMAVTRGEPSGRGGGRGGDGWVGDYTETCNRGGRGGDGLVINRDYLSSVGHSEPAEDDTTELWSSVTRSHL